MPFVADVLSYADYLKVSPLAIDEDRCVAVRNRNATCRRCCDACLAAAITVQQNMVSVDPDVCVRCGVCTTVCPTCALSLLEPTSAQVLSSTLKTADRPRGMGILACARAAARHEADPERFAEVPCLGAVGEPELLGLAAAGLDDILLVDGDCATCKYGAADGFITTSVHQAADMLEAVGAQAIITRTSQFPPEVLSPRRANVRGEDRRGLLAQTGRSMRSVAGNVAKKTMEEKLGGAQARPRTLKDRLSAGHSGRMPTFQPEGNFQLLECLEKTAERPEGLSTSEVALETRRFGSLAIDADQCSGCGLCVLFCPTAALSHAEFDRPEREDRKYLEFSAELCTQCGLCRDVCLRKCLEVSPKVSLASLFDLEPELLEISRPEERASLFDRFRSS